MENKKTFYENKRPLILIVDDSEINREILADMLGDGFEILQAENGVEAVGILKRRTTDIELVMLDMVMPEMDGFEVLAVMNKYHWIDSIPVIMISVETSESCIERAYDMGITEYIRRPFDTATVRQRVQNTILLYAKQRRLVGMVTDQIYEKEKNNDLMINILSHIVEFRNGESGLHVLHIHTITEMLLNQLVEKYDNVELTREEIALVSNASALHDIGKIAIPAEILNKPGRLTPEEFEIMKTHSAVGADMLSQLSFYQDEPLVKIAYEICRYHHERYDGRGYPDGLKGDEIPLSAQIVSIADVYDALTSERVYKSAYSHDEAMRMIKNGECGAFNPILLDCLDDISDKLKKEMKVNSISHVNRRELQRVTGEMFSKNEITVSEQLAEMERRKYDFFQSVSHELQFDFISDPRMVIVPEHTAKKLDLPENIVDPINNARVREVMKESDMRELAKRLRSANRYNPCVEYECDINFPDGERHVTLICRAMWSQEAPPVYIGAVGIVRDCTSDKK